MQLACLATPCCARTRFILFFNIIVLMPKRGTNKIILVHYSAIIPSASQLLRFFSKQLLCKATIVTKQSLSEPVVLFLLGVCPDGIKALFKLQYCDANMVSSFLSLLLIFSECRGSNKPVPWLVFFKTRISGNDISDAALVYSPTMSDCLRECAEQNFGYYITSTVSTSYCPS